MNKPITTIATVIAALSISACQFRPLGEPEYNVTVEMAVNKDKVYNVTSDIYNPRLERPGLSTGMVRCMFYDAKTKELVGQSFISNKKVNENGQDVIYGSVNIAPGTYNLVCYNFDTPNTLVKGENGYETITAYTSEVPSAVAKSFDIEDVTKVKKYYDPDHLVVSRDKELSIVPHTDEYTIKTTAATCIDTYYIQVRVRGGQNISNVIAVIDGLSPENQFGIDSRDTSNPSAVYFTMKRDIDEHLGTEDNEVICGLFNTFGKIENAPSNASIVITVTSSEGKKYEKTVSLENAFKSENAIKHHWLLIDEVIVIPDPPKPESSGGFDPRIEDWDDEDAVIIL